ncbi:MAG: 50S ribosomal protein L13 [Dehalococcoidales bacterium]|nr:50S ribosomal protein L13 [Dehalococcoidales bacterium]
MVKTYSAKASDIKREWHVIDATDQVLGRLATEVARLLMGKNKAMFTRNIDTGDYVVIINAEKIRTSGNKGTGKFYYRHSGYPGGFRTISLDEMLKNKPEFVIEHAVKGMLPHNRLGNSMIKKLKVYAGDTHPHAAQVAAKK